jgi:hypothetical protein
MPKVQSALCTLQGRDREDAVSLVWLYEIVELLTLTHLGCLILDSRFG